MTPTGTTPRRSAHQGYEVNIDDDKVEEVNEFIVVVGDEEE
jgi:hypothetical protein